MEAIPKEFDGVCYRPKGCNAGTINFQVRSCDGAVSGAEMCHQVDHRYVSKSKCGVLENCEVHGLDGGQNLFFDFLTEGSGECEFSNGSLVKVDTFGNLILSLRGGMFGVSPGWIGSWKVVPACVW